MSQQDQQGFARQITCPSCGASNHYLALRCTSCGTLLQPDYEPEETIIDVSTGRPEVVSRNDPNNEWTRNAPAGWMDGAQFNRDKVFISTGGLPGCLLSIAALGLLGFCVCIVLWSAVGSINWL